MRHILNIAHRGFTKRLPGNTLEAFEAAIELGVDGIECDVQETADCEFILFHDTELVGNDITRLRSTQIKEVMLENRFNIPTLEEALELCKTRVKLIIDVKRLRSFDRFARLLRSRPDLDSLVVSSFDQDLVLRLSYLAPDIRKGVILDSPAADPFAVIKSALSDTIVMRFPFVDMDLVDYIHRHNSYIFVWGCADLGDIRKTLRLDIDGIISDFPDLVLHELRTMS
ncbi:MAG: glycerophosphodiester phosphodiesterase [Dehalococcoidia bacterium]|nr:MAG: glycerophosphodiester phosphodiesterase [Dehalococcoidia bacterium]